jgi:hypothetical protein
VPDNEACIREVKDAGVYISEDPLTFSNRIVTAGSDSSGKLVGEKVLELLGST